ncbi:MAG TPA: Crp/Fnr family transcriptional regulator [Pyrinomonadaceae bacterium]|nr:Crp/Fnr family transcriptional regulator [Pyrinomonadaceae bacterium]
MTHNLLLAKFPGDELERLRPHFEPVSLAHGQHAIVPDEPIRHFYYPSGCLLSMVTTMADGSTVESGVIGREGMSGIPVLLDAEMTTMPTFVQVPGEAVRIRARFVKEAYERNGHVRKLLNRYMHTVVVVGSHSAACNRLHKLEERFCRWLLMSSDGVGSDEVALTHEYLAVMLGVRRAGVTEAAVKVQGAGVIIYRRGHVRILDRERLEAMACECYGRTKSEYERLLGD